MELTKETFKNQSIIDFPNEAEGMFYSSFFIHCDNIYLLYREEIHISHCLM